MVKFEDWKRTALGHKIDLDNQSYDCVDVPKHWAQFGTALDWRKSLCWGNAKDIYGNCPTTYWNKIPKGNRPQPGDIACMNGSVGGGYGHVGVVVSVDGNNMTIYQQNTFTQTPVATGVFGWNSSYIQGYLRPKFAVDYGTAPAVSPNERMVGSGGVNYREAPNQSGKVIKLFPQGDVLTFKGFVRGEAVDSNNIWFVGAFTGGYAWSGGFTDKGTHDLPDLTPEPALQPFQRKIGSDAVNYRKDPHVAPDNVIQLFPAGEVLDFKGWVYGQPVNGNSIWFVGKYTGGYVWSGGFADKGVHDLANLNAVPLPDPVPEPEYKFLPEFDFVEVIPAAVDNFKYGNFPDKPAKLVLHDFGTEGHDTIGSTLNEFKRKGSEKSAHFVVSGKRIVQMVSLKDRAYHAGPNGNGFVGVESDPKQDTDTIASVNKLLNALRDRYGYVLPLIKHSQIMVTKCGDDVDFANYEVKPVPEPEPLPTPAPPTPPLPPDYPGWFIEFWKKLWEAIKGILGVR